MNDSDKPREKLISELEEMRAHLDRLEKGKLEADLRKSERLLQSSIDGMLEGYALHEALFDEKGVMKDYRFLKFNHAAQKIVGITEEEIIGKTALELFPNIVERGLMKRYADVIATGKPDYIEDFYYEGDNLDRAFDISCFPVDDRHFVCVFRDITNRKKADEAFMKNRYYLEKAQEIGKVGTWELDMLKNELIWTNQNYDNFGIPIGSPLNYEIFLDCVHPEDRNYVNNEWMSALKGKPYDIEHRIIVDGQVRWVREKADITFDDNGSGVYAIGFTQDITEHKQLEKELLKIQKLESVGVLAGGIAHDFNNLLAGILNNIYLTKMHVNHESDAYESLKSAEKAVNRAANLTSQLLTFSKGGAPVMKAASIEGLIKESSDFVLSGSNVTCRYDIADNLCQVEIDEGQISQAIQNLIINANQSMPDGGIVTICVDNFCCSTDKEPKIEEGEYVKIVVKDQGEGIDSENLNRIFDPYYTTKEMGQGLGLSLTYSIIKNHRGHITVGSEKGSGSTFTVYIPAAPCSIEEAESKDGSLPMGHGKVLLMDDEEIIRNSIRDYLNNVGYQTECAENGAEAVELYKQSMEASRPFDVVMLDLTIRGGMGGKDTISKLKEINPQVKAIVCSGYSNNPVLANYKEYGFSDVFNKGYHSPEDLCRMLSNLMAG